MVAERLWGMREELPGCMVVVPTAESGRRLREKLAELGGCLAPRVVTPEVFFRVAGKEGVATDVQEQWVWMEALREMKVEGLSEVFPVMPSERNFDWAFGVATSLRKVSRELGMSGMEFATVVSLESCEERGRWEQLGELQRRVREKLGSLGLCAGVDAQRREADGAEMAVERVIVAGVTDPVRLAVRVWERWEAAGGRVDVWVQAPESEREFFDGWGIPRENWGERGVGLRDEQIRVAGSERGFGAFLVEECVGWESEDVTLGLCDGSFAQVAEVGLGEAGWSVWNPQGQAAGGVVLSWFEEFLSCVGGDGGWGAWVKLLRHPLFGRLVGVEKWYEALILFDELDAKFLPNEAGRLVEILEREMAEMGGGGREKYEALKLAWDWLGERWEECREKSGRELVEIWVNLLEKIGWDDGVDGKWLGQLMADGMSLEKLGEISGVDGLRLVCKMIPVMRVEAGHEEAAVDLLGWLEMTYAAGKKTILLGVHEGCVPDRGLDDAFLSDRVRCELGLRNAASRLAEDAHRLAALLASCEVRVLVAQVNPQGEVCRPSRLLLGEKGEFLARRVRALFAEQEQEVEALPSWDRGEWKLVFDEKLQVWGERALSPSRLRDYLHCPFRFYLKEVLGWREFEAAQGEMRSHEFGTLLHDVLKGMAQDEVAKKTRNVRELREFLWVELERLVEKKYGKDWSLEIYFQYESAKQRLEAFARCEIAEREAGWEIWLAEYDLGTKEKPWMYGGYPLVMKVDRVDRRGSEIRVLDYKTSASASAPLQAHRVMRKSWLRSQRRDFFVGTDFEIIPDRVEPGHYVSEEERAMIARKRWVWANVQLPLYAEFFTEFAETPKNEFSVSVGYVNLPAQVVDVKFAIWEDYEEYREMIAAWTGQVLRAIHANVFWPPAELNSGEKLYDPWAALAPDGLVRAVSGDLIEEMWDVAEAYDMSVRCRR